MHEQPAQPPSIAEIVSAAQAGDYDAFATLVERFQDMAYGVAYAWLGDFHQAEDVAQEAFIQAYRDIASLREPAAFGGWLRQIVRKHCDRATRKAKLPSAPLGGAEEMAAPAASPQRALERAEVTQEILGALILLPDHQREALTLYYLHERSEREVAEILGVEAGTLKKRLHDARANLRKQASMVDEKLRKYAPSRDRRFARQVLSTAVPLLVGWIDADGGNDPAGGGEHTMGATTIGRAGVEIPDSRWWFVQPRPDLPGGAWSAVLDEVRERRIPGIYARGGVDDALLARIADQGHLRFLALVNCPAVSDAGLAYLARLPRLQHLSLIGTGATDAALAVLRQLPGLEVVRLRGDTITDAGVAHLAPHRQLRMVDLAWTMAGDGAIATLAGKPDLCHFLPGPRTTDAGLVGLRHFPGLTDWREGRPLYMHNEYAAPSPSSLFIEMRRNGSLTDAGIAALAELRGLHSLKLFYYRSPSRLTSAGVLPLLGLEHLRHLNLCGAMADDAALAGIGRMRRLEQVELQWTVAGDDGFAALADCAPLTKVFFDGERVGARGFAALARLPKLSWMNFGGKNLGDRDIEALADFPALRDLWPNHLGDEGYRVVGRVQSLESLTNMYCKDTTDAATAYIRALPRLKSYHVWGAKISDHSLELLSGMTTLEDLLFYRCDIGDAGLAHLAALPRLRKLDIQQSPRVTAAGVAALPERIAVNFQPG
jgi:RNA polymerase sigma factor (sigma-70 family)